jgi:hypothetical protein
MNERTRSARPESEGRCHCTELRKASRRISQLYETALAPSGLKTTQRDTGGNRAFRADDGRRTGRRDGDGRRRSCSHLEAARVRQSSPPGQVLVVLSGAQAFGSAGRQGLGVDKARPTHRRRIQIRNLCQRMSRVPHHPRLVLAGHPDQKILRGHGGLRCHYSFAGRADMRP